MQIIVRGADYALVGMSTESRESGSATPFEQVDLRELHELSDLFNRLMGAVFLGPGSAGDDAGPMEELPLSQKKLMFLLEQRGALRMTDLAHGLNLTLSGATGLVDKLVRTGMVARESDAADRRVIRVRMTPAGLSASRQCMAVQARCFRGILERLAPEKRRGLLAGFRTIHGLLAEMDDAAGEPGRGGAGAGAGPGSGLDC